MAASQVIAKFTTELEHVDIDGLLQKLWKEGVIKPQPYFEALKKPFEEKLSFVQLQLSIGGEDVFPTFLECLRTLKHWQLASDMEAEWKKKGGKGPTESGNALPSNEAVQASGISKPVTEGATIDDLRRAKTVLKDRDVYISINEFLDTLAERKIISVAEEMKLREMSDYHAQIDAVFKILFARDVERHYYELIETLKSMGRLDIVKKIQK
ncbi:unnamed protein product [Darwinula stevensoni]|uniref:CARD domain-containing protein n=1 Tax=Darwinula stevensoni TaxID=69355 RepID=A0A7R9FNR1_9CRUS|nr:unnamed protein product [Darwinula stevensoni]CAG0896994.1 unnamed protein product [Darwinula stevensoni]